MYATTTANTELALVYDTLTGAELDLRFAEKIMSLIHSNQIPDFMNLAHRPENHWKAINTGVFVSEFLARRRHIRYYDWRAFNGTTGVDPAVPIVAASLVRGLAKSAEPVSWTATGRL